MSEFLNLVKKDIWRFYKYRIFHIELGISFLMAVTIGFFKSVNPANFLYLIVLIMPVVIFSFSLRMDLVSLQLVPRPNQAPGGFKLLGAKLVSATALQLIPFLMFVIVIVFVRKTEIVFSLFLLEYLVAVVLHIVIGLTMATISGSDKTLAFGYMIYIIVFCMGPIFLSNGMIPSKFEYYFIYSPAYLSGVVLDNILAGVMYSPLWLMTTAVFVQIGLIFLLSYFMILPFFRDYIGILRKQGGENANQ